MEMRSVMVNEADLIEKLFQQVYNREQGVNYWKWCFQNPHGYINCGMFDGNRLMGYYAAQYTEVSACMYSAMVHPNYRKQGIYLKLAQDLSERISTNRAWLYLFSNEMIRPIHLEKEGFIEAYQIKEYRIPITDMIDEPAPFSLGDFWNYEIWRYREHPLISYHYHDLGIFSEYEDRVQIIDFKFKNLEKAIRYAQQFGFWDKKKYVSFWCEVELDYPFIMLPTWKQYQIFDKNISFDDIMSLDKLRMGMSDVF